MSFDFPASPAEGASYSPAGGPRYIYTSGVWRSTGMVATGTAEARNRIVNGAMQISQENGNTAGTANAYFAADQWSMVKQHSAGTMTAQRVQSITPNGSKDRIRITITAADAALAAGEYLNWDYRIEGGRIADFRYGSASAKQSVLRFGWKSPAGTYSIAITNAANDRSYVVNFIIAAGQANVDTEQTFIIPGDTTGTWLTDTGQGLIFGFMIACGATYQGVAGWQAGSTCTVSNTNGMATAGAVYELWDVGLYLDPLATGVAPAWTMPDEGEEMRTCQRYYQGAHAIWSGYSSAGSTFYTSFQCAVRPRIDTPALNAAHYSGSGFLANPAGVAYQASGQGGYYYNAAGQTLAAGMFAAIIQIDARM